MSDRPSHSALPFAADEGDSDAGSHRAGGRDRRLLRWLVIGAVLVLAALYVAGYAFASDRLPRGTTVAGVEIGGQRPQGAERELREALEEPMRAPIELVVEDEQFALDPEKVGLDVDIPASIAQVPVGRSWNPADMWENFVGGESYEPVVVTVDGMLRERLDEIASQVGDPAVNGAIAFTDAGPKPTYGEAGTSLDVEAAADEIREVYPTKGASIEAELVKVEPNISSAEVSRAMQRFANPAMSAPVTLALDGEEITLEPADYAEALSMKPKDGKLVPRVDGEKLVELVAPLVSSAGAEPVDATVRIENGRPVVVPGQKGVTIRQGKLQKVFLDVVGTRGGDRRATVPTKAEDPERTAEEVRALGIKEKVSEFTTYYPHADYRNTNIGRAAEIVDGTLLEPGETFSLNETVGERTRENGFTEGFIISNGVLKEDLGGGVSQMATTLFNAAFFAGLEDVEHKPHSFYIDRYPVGREATVAWPVVDLRFKNNTDHGVLINAIHQPSSYSSQGAITVEMWSTKVWDIESITGERYAFTSPDTRYMSGEDCVPNDGYGGFSIDVTRVFRKPGESEVDHTEKFHTVYTPSDTVICQ